MTVELYVTLDGTDSRFDGHRAQTHLSTSVAGLAQGDRGFLHPWVSSLDVNADTRLRGNR
jgi:hypothetical protein